MPTVVPIATFSLISFAAALVSVGVVTLNSSRSLIVILNDWLTLSHHWIGLDGDCASLSVVFAIDGCSGGDDASVGVDLEEVVWITG